ncbi:MAG: FliI/YscN family ATPase, partial [Geopsychrobacter sp.]|nr:FliI/YscN family ATPase [Geopsychrobacter sp.]
MMDIVECIRGINPLNVSGKVTQIVGLVVEGFCPASTVGTLCELIPLGGGEKIPAEVVGFRDSKALLMPLGDLRGLGPGSLIRVVRDSATLPVGDELLGRVIDALGVPLDNRPAPKLEQEFPLYAQPVSPMDRDQIVQALDLGVRSINGLLTCGQGQRMGIMAGSGVGKSILLSMFARYARSDVSVIGLIGERGREVQEFIEDDLGEEGLARSVLVVATSDETALMRRQAAYMTLTISEYFRDQGNDVLCLMDSVTRFAMAQREIGLAGGEPPASKGYTPTVFTELPRLLERAGPGIEKGSITGLFTVLVEGDDHNEPIS